MQGSGQKWRPKELTGKMAMVKNIHTGTFYSLKPSLSRKSTLMKKAVRDHKQNPNAGIHRRQLLRTTALTADAALLINPVSVTPFIKFICLVATQSQSEA